MVRTTHIRVNINGKWYAGLKVKVPPPRRRCVSKNSKKVCWDERTVAVYIPKHIKSEYVVVLPYEALEAGVQEVSPQGNDNQVSN